MKLEKFSKNKKQKKVIIGIMVGLILLISGITLYRTFALYEEKKEFNVLRGKVPELRDIRLSITIDGEKAEKTPKKGNYETTVNCTSGDGTFDYVTWSLNVEDFESGARCTLAFSTSNLSSDELTKRAVAKRRNTYRGKNITDHWKDGSLYTMISNGTFDDIYVGDFIIDDKGNKWLIADLDNYLNTGDKPLTKHHATIIPENPGIMKAQMNTSQSTEGGYKGSQMYTTHLNTYLNTYIIPTFGSHVLTYRNYITNKVNVNINSSSYAEYKGASIGTSWEDRKLDLMSEINVLGTMVWSSSAYDVGIDRSQYAIFRLRPNIINPDTVNYYWLKSVSTMHTFCLIDPNGMVEGGIGSAAASAGVRPRFLIG